MENLTLSNEQINTLAHSIKDDIKSYILENLEEFEEFCKLSTQIKEN